MAERTNGIPSILAPRRATTRTPSGECSIASVSEQIPHNQ